MLYLLLAGHCISLRSITTLLHTKPLSTPTLGSVSIADSLLTIGASPLPYRCQSRLGFVEAFYLLDSLMAGSQSKAGAKLVAAHSALPHPNVLSSSSLPCRRLL